MADLLAQAEHDTDAVPMLIATSEVVAAAVDAALTRQLVTLPTRATAAVALTKGWACVVPDLTTAAAVSDVVAPEHLEVQVAGASAFAREHLHNYGAVFIGSRTAEGSLGRYANWVRVFSLSRDGLLGSVRRLRSWTKSRLADRGDGPLHRRAVGFHVFAGTDVARERCIRFGRYRPGL